MTLSGAASATASTDAAGNYTFQGLTNGSYTVTPGKTDYTFSPAGSAQTVNGTNITAVNFITASTPSQLDLTFGTGGIVTSDLGAGDYAYTLAIQDDGKIIAAGTSDPTAQYGNEFALVRYNTNGSLDSTFGSGGKIATQSDIDYARALLIQADGKILVIGQATWDYGVARFNQNGSFDGTFGNGGVVKADVGIYDYPWAAALQADGKIVVAGTSGGSNLDFAVIRYNSDGSLDSTFGNSGKVVSSVNSFDDWARAVSIQTDGKIVVAGYCSNGADFDFCAVRYNANGGLDTTFGSLGKVLTNFGSQSNDTAWDMTIQSDGKIVLVGSCNNDIFSAARYNADGSLDADFGTNGILTTAIRDMDIAQSVAVQTNGKIVVAGKSWKDSFYDFAVVRYNSDGSIDTSFGGGEITTGIGSFDDEAYAVVLQADGKIVAAGSTYNGTNSDFAVVRYLP
jgi:uncharacterized delta-60 repeat protein